MQLLANLPVGTINSKSLYSHCCGTAAFAGLACVYLIAGLTVTVLITLIDSADQDDMGKERSNQLSLSQFDILVDKFAQLEGQVKKRRGSPCVKDEVVAHIHEVVKFIKCKDEVRLDRCSAHRSLSTAAVQSSERDLILVSTKQYA
jgi:hypothetical protein